MDHTNDGTNVAQTRSDGAEPGGQGKQRKRGSRGGQNRRPSGRSQRVGSNDKNDVELPDRLSEGRPSAEASERGLVRKPQIGDTMPIPSSPPPGSLGSQTAEHERRDT